MLLGDDDLQMFTVLILLVAFELSVLVVKSAIPCEETPVKP